nr:hypothetical protein [Tanacetum cinerariifolium]
MKEQSFISTIHQKTNPVLLQFCLFSCFLSQEEPKKIFDALKDPSWVEAMQEELLQFKIQNVWILVDCPKVGIPRKKELTMKKSLHQLQGLRLLDYSYASFIGFIVYQMDVKSAFLYGTIDEEVYVMQPPGFQDPEFSDRVYKVEKAMYGLHYAPRAWSANTPMDKENPWEKDGPGKDVELHLYRSMIGSLMYLTASRPDIMFAVCACARHQVTPKECHLHAVKRIFRYLKDLLTKPFDAGSFQYLVVEQVMRSSVRGNNILCTTDFWSTVRIETTNQETKILATVDGKSQTISESLLRRHLKLRDAEGNSSLPDAELFENLSLMGYNILPNQRITFQKGQFSHQWKFLIHTIMQCLSPKSTGFNEFSSNIATAVSKALSLAADELASLLRDVRQGEAFPTYATKTSGIDGNLYQPAKRKCRAYSRGCSNQRGIIEIREEVGAEKSIELGSNDIEEMVNVLSSIEAACILISGVATASVSPAASVSAAGIPTVSGGFPTVSAIFTTAIVATPYSRRPKRITIGGAQHMRSPIIGVKYKGKQKVVEFEEITILHAEEELKMMIEGLDRSNEVIAKHLQEYKQVKVDLTVEEKIKLINELVKYQDHHAKILKYQAQQSKPLSKKEQREFYMSILRSHAGWKPKHFRGMALEEIREKFIPVWKQLEDFVPMSSKNKLVPLEEVYVEALQVKHLIIDWEIHSEGKREYWKIIRLGGHSAVYQFFVNMLKQFDREDLHQLWILVKETFSIRHATKDKEKELWVELKRLFEPDFKDQLWTQNQAFMHDPLDWKLYDTCGVHHVSTKDQEIFMLVERDYPLRRGLATVMICNKLQVKQYSQMANDLILKIHNIADSLR